jgi:hypothetical protein
MNLFRFNLNNDIFMKSNQLEKIFLIFLYFIGIKKILLILFI